MKLLLHMNMPSGQNDGTHQIILEMPTLAALTDLAPHIEDGFLLGNHLVYSLVHGKREWISRGPMAVNFDHVGKIAEYYEGT